MSGRKGLFLAIGAVAGFVAGVCFAPKEGSETRKDAKEKLQQSSEKNQENLPDLTEELKWYQFLKEKRI